MNTYVKVGIGVAVLVVLWFLFTGSNEPAEIMPEEVAEVETTAEPVFDLQGK